MTEQDEEILKTRIYRMVEESMGQSFGNVELGKLNFGNGEVMHDIRINVSNKLFNFIAEEYLDEDIDDWEKMLRPIE